MARKRRESKRSIARAAIAALSARDTMARHDGMEIEAIRPGYARLRMHVRPEMLNGHGVCHGGRLFGLADTAFAFACNSYGILTVAMNCQISYLKPVMPQATVTATAQERSRGRKTGVYDVEIRDEKGVLVALFRGTSFSTDGPVPGLESDT